MGAPLREFTPAPCLPQPTPRRPIQPHQLDSRGSHAQTQVSADEQPASARPEKIPQLKPAFREGGTVTAANSSSISDGAAALVLADEDSANAKGLHIRARIVGADG